MRRLVVRSTRVLALLCLVAGCTAATEPEPAVGSVTQGIVFEHSLAVTEVAVLRPFTLERVMQQIIDTSRARYTGLTPRMLFNQWWDTQNRAPGLNMGPHCDDEQTPFGLDGHNQFPWECERDEGYQARVDPFRGRPDEHLYMPIGLFNRFDLAPSNGAHCGEYRIVFAMRPGHPDARGRNFLIFEAVLPNPRPEEGLRGCYDVAAFWADLTGRSADERRELLEKFYFYGLEPFEPVVKADHFGTHLGGDGYGCSTGQIRTNQFVGRPWNLREFRLVEDCRCREEGYCRLMVAPTTVKESPHGPLFDENSPEPLAHPFEWHTVGAVWNLAVGGVGDFGWGSLDNQYNSGESVAEFGYVSDYLMHFQNGAGGWFENQLAQQLSMMPWPYNLLTPEHIVKRAQALSCAGCHHLSNNEDLGLGVHWPPSLDFTHVEEFEQNGFYPISPALKEFFLPKRAEILLAFLESGQGTGQGGKCRLPLPRELAVRDCREFLETELIRIREGRGIPISSVGLEKLKPRFESLLNPNPVH